MPRGYPKNGINKTSFKKGHAGYWSDKKRPPFSKEHKEKISESHKGDKNPSWGKRGEKSLKYIKDRTLLKKTDHRANTANWEWKRQCKKRDKNKCRIADGNCKGQLEIHHILSYKEYPELRYDINNGITMCHFHHPRSKEKERQMIPILKIIIESNI